MFSTKKIVDYCAREVERQGDGALFVGYMFDAWELCLTVDMRGGIDHLTEWDIKTIQVKVLNCDTYGYRIGPAVFNQGMPALAAPLIARQMELLLENQSVMSVNEFTYRFLEIHPFADGNGRVASLLYNLKRGTLLNPADLPEYNFN